MWQNSQMFEQLQESLHSLNIWKDHRLLWVSSTTSTNDDLKSIWRNKDFNHLIEVADLQTNGKGQYDRKWASSSIGQCLMFSFTIDIKEYEFPISMIAGAALAIALEELGLKTSDFWLKWPNDIWVNNKKLSGILTESTTIKNGFRSVVGIGINILPLQDNSVNATSLKENGVNTTREELLNVFFKSFDRVFSSSASQQAYYWKKYAGQFFQRKFKVQVPNQPAYIAKVLSIKEDGRLIVKTSKEEEKEIIAASLFPII